MPDSEKLDSVLPKTIIRKTQICSKTKPSVKKQQPIAHPNRPQPESSSKNAKKNGAKPSVSLNEASRYKNYNKIQDPMKNHEAFIETHYARLHKIHHEGGAVDCSCPRSLGKYQSKWRVVGRWNAINRDRYNYKLFEFLETATTHYDHLEAQRSYLKNKQGMKRKYKLAKVNAGSVWPLRSKLSHFKSVETKWKIAQKRNNGLQL